MEEWADCTGGTCKGQNTVKARQVVVTDAKDTLVLHAKRAQHDRGAGGYKNNAPIEIDMEITLNGRGYLLHAVAVHRGQNSIRGHWYCYRRIWSTTEPAVANWWRMDNTTLEQVNQGDVLKETKQAAFFVYRARPRRDLAAVAGRMGDASGSQKVFPRAMIPLSAPWGPAVPPFPLGFRV